MVYLKGSVLTFSRDLVDRAAEMESWWHFCNFPNFNDSNQVQILSIQIEALTSFELVRLDII